MAGNIVKWWKHKILGGYKQFSVQECTTDSEELMYHQVRASSSCSAPPDLLLVSERDNNIQLRSPVVNIITTPPGNASGTAGNKQLQQQGHQHHQALPHTHASRHHHQHPMQLPQDMSSSGSHTKHLRISSSSAGGKHGKYANVQQQTVPPGVDEDVVDAAAAAQPSAQQQQQHSRHLHHHKEERIRLEEFTCDVSVEGGKSSQPLQFSFTFYDLDGHHGKITKDDIVGIVYTIYESIGKSVVVPHCGSKTINVRLTVSPEGKSKSAQPLPAAAFGGGNNNNNSSSNNNKLKKLPMGLAAAMAKQVNGGSGGGALTTSAGTRRQHRYRPRKLIKSDDEDDDSNSDKEKDALAASADRADQQPSGSGGTKGAGGSKSHHHQHHHGRYQQKSSSKVEQCCVGAATELQQTSDNTYENMLNLKQEQQPQQPTGNSNDVADCPSHRQLHHQRQQDIYMKQATQRVKMLRRARKQKYQDHCMETRQRSLSVGNDWQHRHLPQSQQPQAANKSASVSPPPASGGELMLDGVQLRQPRHHQSQTQSHHQQQQQRKSAECWKSALNRNDLISIIRESMEKNRLCFQLNGKPQANVSPIRQPAAQQQQQQQRQRSSTGSKIPTLIANHSPAAQSPVSCSPTCSHPAAATCNIPAASAAQAQAPIEQGGAGHHHDHPQPHVPIYHQQLAINPAVLAAQHSHNSAHNKLNLCGYDSFLHATICGGGSAAHSPPPTTTTPSNVATVQPIPKKSHNQKSLLQGYQRLEQQQQQQQQQQRSSKDYKNYGNLIYAKLSEQLQQKEREQRRHRHKQQHQLQQIQQQQQPLKPKEESLPEQQREQQQQRPPTSSSSSTGSKIFGDALECAHLLASEEEDLPASPPLTSTPSKVVSTDTLIDLNDDVGEAVAEAVTEGGKALEADEDDSHQEVELDTSASSSMIHRYVHEHIHHHYHHFKEQQDV
ncbi:protein naked cuticle isoform X1 [Drosophila guanche]|uniref:Protein naked cuticle n=2 Tax=Drosophila guanche TaxID=7266 RepID=A0A3B0JT62_DROGU|nr:protein naked cuticle isoform X1 [Drosophila guanche]SPP76546.1 blast:Protein naked cuticle [Drosophila guanche]